MNDKSFDERRLCTYLCDYKKIEDFNNLLNFYQEVSEASLKSKNISAWQIKLRWFLEAVSNTQNNYSPIINNFNKLNLLNEYLISLLEAKNIDLDTQPFQKEEDLITYAEETGGNLWVLAGLITNKDINEKQKLVLKHCGAAFAILGLIRNYKFNEKRGIHTLIYTGQSTNQYHNQDQIKNNIKSLILRAKPLISTSNQQKKYLPRKIKRLLLLNNFTLGYIANFEKSNYIHEKTILTNIPKKYYIKLMWEFIHS
jgi:phytoene/squalene synthetase